jgi:hypothetical protein
VKGATLAPIIAMWPEVPEENMHELMKAARKYEKLA